MIKLLDSYLTSKKNKMSSIRIATRNSPLALWQANYVKEQLTQAHSDLEIEIISMTTEGDQLLDRNLATVGGKGLFLKELEISLLNQETDIAVHSMKDVPVTLPDGLEIAVVCERGDPRDAFVSNTYQNLYALPQGSRIGTSSLRRIAQLKSAFPTIEFIELRGNVNTRLDKLDSGEYDAIILAAAGLIRLGYADRIKQYIAPELCLPAVGQGIVGIECRSDDKATQGLLEPLHNQESALYIDAERAMNAALEGGCQVPIAGYAEVEKGKIRMRGMVGEVDGTRCLSTNMTSAQINQQAAVELGALVAEDLLKQGAGEILASISREPVKLQQPTKPAVILTRQARYLANTATILETLDYRPVHLPTLKIKPNESAELSAVFQRINEFTDIVFVSRNAVQVGMPMIEQQLGLPHNVRVMAVGAETAKQLYSYGVDALYPDHGSGAKALLGVSQLADLSGRNILIVRGAHGLDWPIEEMRTRGATVETAECYRHGLPGKSAERLATIMTEHHQIKGVFVHSAQSAINFMSLIGEYRSRLKSTKLIVGSERIAEIARNHGWTNEIRVAESPSNKHMMICFSG